MTESLKRGDCLSDEGGEPSVHYNDQRYSAGLFSSIHGSTVQQHNEPMNLILCLDGTENNFGTLPFSNALKLFRMLEKDSLSQLCYYQPGIGVEFSSQSTDFRETNFINSKISSIASKFDSILAFTLEYHVIAAYNFLGRFYKRGDKIYLFGFSRGSFCARILAAMIERVGLLNPGLEEMTSTAWNLYCNWEFAGQPAQQDSTVSLIQEFKETFSRKDVEIHFMGLWDTVNSVGIFRGRLFPYTSSSRIVEHVRHAVSIDERRAKFKQLLFAPYSYYPCLLSLLCTECEMEEEHTHLHHNGTVNESPFSTALGNRLPSDPSEDVIELFFPGNHGDCGGGWPPDMDGQYLSDIPLRWMLSQAIKFGVLFKSDIIHDFNNKHPVQMSLLSCNHDLLSLCRTKTMQHSRAGPIQRLDRIVSRSNDDLLVFPASNNYQTVSSNVRLPNSPVHRFDSRGNEFFLETLLWWMIELLPIGYKIENKDGQWKKVFVPNLGRPRKIPRDSMFHWSLFYRLHYVEDYKPTNIPLDLIGQKFLESLGDFKSKYKGLNIEQYCEELTAEKIRKDWQSEIWRILPDELEEILIHNPYL